MKNMYKSFDFDYNLIKKHYDKIKTTIEKIDYLEWIITEYKNSGQPHQTSIIIQKPNRSITAAYMGGEPLIRTIEIPSDQFIEKINNDLNLFKKRLEREKSTSTDMTKAITYGKENSNTNKIHVISDSTDITRIFENAKLANIISKKTQITQIVDIFFNMKRSNYDKNKSELNKPLPAKSGTETFFEFVKLCSSNLPTNKIDKLIDYLNQLDK
jgi:hypothetical protein